MCDLHLHLHALASATVSALVFAEACASPGFADSGFKNPPQGSVPAVGFAKALDGRDKKKAWMRVRLCWEAGMGRLLTLMKRSYPASYFKMHQLLTQMFCCAHTA